MDELQLLNALRKAIEHSGRTRYRLSVESGVAQSQLSRLMSGERGVSIAVAARLAEALGLEIVIRPKQRKG